MREVDRYWLELFNENGILAKIQKEGFYEISAKLINTKKEARLMTKFDNENSLPEIFKQYNLGILPNTRGTYIIAPMKLYEKINIENDEIETVQVIFPDYIESIKIDEITSEAIALNAAFISNILQDFLGEELYPTINGRMGSKEFNFNVELHEKEKINIQVKNSQIEIDAGYESLSKLYLIEAKNNLIESFLIRQLYYPYRLWKEKMKKEVVPIFFIYSNGTFRIYKYMFSDETEYNSLKLIKSKKYTFIDKEIYLDDILSILENIKRNNNSLHCPQADSFERLISICESIKRDGVKKSYEIKEEQDFTMRQSNYYLSAGRLLNLFEVSKKGEYNLTSTGNFIFSQGYRKRHLLLVKEILKIKIFRDSLNYYFENFDYLPANEIISYLIKFYKINETTARRRTSTIIGWTKWILNLIDN